MRLKLGTHYGPARNIGPTGHGRPHSGAHLPLLSSPSSAAISDDYGPGGAAGVWTSPPPPLEQQNSFGSTAGQMDANSWHCHMIIISVDFVSSNSTSSRSTHFPLLLLSEIMIKQDAKHRLMVHIYCTVYWDHVASPHVHQFRREHFAADTNSPMISCCHYEPTDS